MSGNVSVLMAGTITPKFKEADRVHFILHLGTSRERKGVGTVIKSSKDGSYTIRGNEGGIFTGVQARDLAHIPNLLVKS